MKHNLEVNDCLMIYEHWAAASADSLGFIVETKYTHGGWREGFETYECIYDGVKDLTQWRIIISNAGSNSINRFLDKKPLEPINYNNKIIPFPDYQNIGPIKMTDKPIPGDIVEYVHHADEGTSCYLYGPWAENFPHEVIRVVHYQWRPIETAPDDKFILLHGKITPRSKILEQVVGFLAFNPDDLSDKAWVIARFETGEGINSILFANPTHWKPLGEDPHGT